VEKSGGQPIVYLFVRSLTPHVLPILLPSHTESGPREFSGPLIGEI
jgi:hypothetical protein